MAAFTYTKPTVGGSEDTWGDTLNANWDAVGTFLGSLDSTELAVLDGITSSTAELNLLDGVTVTLADITATATELNLLDGVTATTAEINYVDGVTSNIQTQLDAKAADNELTQRQVEDDTSTVFGQVSGQRLAQAGVVSFTDQEQQIGVGQTWQTVSRSVGVSYQNTTGKPIEVVWDGEGGSIGSAQVSIDNVNWIYIGGVGASNERQVQVTVPDQWYYRQAGGDRGPTVELR